MSQKVTVINVSPVAQAVPGYGEAAPGQGLAVDQRVAVHLLKSEAWQEPKPAEKKGAGRQAPRPAPMAKQAGEKKSDKEVTNGAA